MDEETKRIELFDLYDVLSEVVDDLKNNIQIMNYVIGKALNDEFEEAMSDPNKGTALYRFYLIAKDQNMNLQILDSYIEQMTDKIIHLEAIQKDISELANGQE